MVDPAVRLPAVGRRPWPWRQVAGAVFALAVAGSLWSVATLAVEFLQTVRLLRTADWETPQWTVNHAEIEFLRFRAELAEAAAAEVPDLRQLRQAYDIFYSRFETLDTGSLIEPLRAIPDFAAILEDIRIYLRETVSIIDLPDPDLAVRIDDLVGPSDDVYRSLRGLSLITLDNWTTETIARRGELARILVELGTVLALSFLVLTAAVIALARLYRLATQRQTELILARDRAVESEAALRDSDARFKRAARLAGLGHFTRHAPDLDLVRCSEEYAAIFGLPVDDLMRRIASDGFLSLLHPEDRETYRVERQQACGDESATHLGYRILRPDGSIRHVLELERRVAPGDDGQHLCEGIVFDITDLKVTDQRLRVSEARLREAQRIAHIGNWESDGIDALTCSHEVLRIFGIMPEEFNGSMSLLLERTHPQDMNRVRETIRTISNTATPQNFVHRIVLPGGEVRTVQTRARVAAADQSDGLSIVGTVQDITELALAEDRLRQAQKMQAIGQLTGGVAHDFNNLLFVIMGSLELLLETRLDDDQRQLAEAGIGATQRGADLTRDMLSFARRAPLTPVSLDVNKVLEETVQWARRVLPATIAIETDAAPALPRVTADATSTKNAILNIILNARDAMPSGGRLTLTTRSIQIGGDGVGPDCRIPEDLEGGEYVRLSIADTGHGIAAADLPRIFEPFFTTKPPGSFLWLEARQAA